MEMDEVLAGLPESTGIPKQIRRHPETLVKKARTHLVVVRDIANGMYTVISGGKVRTGGNEYTITVFGDGSGAACTCDWAIKRTEALAENKGASACSHTIAVFMFIAEGQGRKVSAHISVEDAKRQHRPQVQAKDGLVLTTRKATRRYVQADFLWMV